MRSTTSSSAYTTIRNTTATEPSSTPLDTTPDRSFYRSLLRDCRRAGARRYRFPPLGAPWRSRRVHGHGGPGMARSTGAATVGPPILVSASVVTAPGISGRPSTLGATATRSLACGTAMSARRTLGPRPLRRQHGPSPRGPGATGIVFGPRTATGPAMPSSGDRATSVESIRRSVPGCAARCRPG